MPVTAGGLWALIRGCWGELGSPASCRGKGVKPPPIRARGIRRVMVHGQLPSAAHDSGVLSTGTDGELSPRHWPLQEGGEAKSSRARAPCPGNMLLPRALGAFSLLPGHGWPLVLMSKGLGPHLCVYRTWLTPGGDTLRLPPLESEELVSPQAGALGFTQIHRKPGVLKPWQEQACANYNLCSLLTIDLGL